MSKRHRNRHRQTSGALVPAIPQPVQATASWTPRSGYSERRFDGSKMRDSLRAAYPTGADLDAATLRARSRTAYWESSHARALLQRLADNVIGTGLTLRSCPAWELIGSALDDEGKRKVSDEIDMRWKLWADSHEPDSMGMRNLAELQAFWFANELRDGELFSIYRYSGDSRRVSSLAIQTLDADQIDGRKTTYGKTDRAGLGATMIDLAVRGRGNTLRDGLELTTSGELVAIYVNDPDDPWKESTRIPVYGERSGRRFVQHAAILDLPGQLRGVGPLAPIVHDIEKLTDYELAEIESTIVNAIVAAAIIPAANAATSTSAAEITGGGIARRGVATTAGAALPPEELQAERSGIVVDRLKAGEDLKSYDTKRPNVNFGGFVETVVKYISASLSIPVEVLEEKFSANYSASRASLILFWQTVQRWRVHVRSQILDPIYESWLIEEVNAGRLPTLRANGFGADPVRTRAWLQAEWVGDSMPSIDPLKDAEAVEKRQDLGHTTAEREALNFNGSDYYDNARRRKAEKEALPPPPPKAGAAPIPESDEPEDPNDKPAKEGDE